MYLCLSLVYGLEEDVLCPDAVPVVPDANLIDLPKLDCTHWICNCV